jgi:hypothetical protein
VVAGAFHVGRLFNEDIDHSHRVVGSDEVVEALRQKRDLVSVLSIDEPSMCDL